MISAMLRRRARLPLALVGLLAALLGYVGLRSGPLAAVAVTVADVQEQALAPALFGIGTVEARYSLSIGPTMTGRLQRLDVEVGEPVRAGQLLGEMDPVDLDQRLRAQQATIDAAQALVEEARQRLAHAASQARRYARLFEARATSEENAATRQHELRLAEAALRSASGQLARARADHDVLLAQRSDLRLVAPLDGLVVARHAEPGATLLAGQAVVELVDPGQYWVNVRFDQAAASGLAGELGASIVLRSRGGEALPGRVLRVEPIADAVTEELLAKVVFQAPLRPLPALGELAEVTVELPELPRAPTIPNAALRHERQTSGVWLLADGGLRFAPVKLGAGDLDGHVQVREGLQRGDRIVVHSEKALAAHQRVRVVERIPGTAP